MMKYTVVNDFIERGSLKQIKAGDTYVCLDPARVEKLKRLGYITEKTAEPVKEPAEPVEKPKKTTAKAKTTAKSSVKTKKA